MKTKNQIWAFTNKNNSVCNMDWERGYFNFECNESIDAPEYVASGSTRENIIDIGGKVERHIIGGIAGRE